MAAEPIRVAIAGVGNCAAALVQAIGHYRDHPANGAIMPSIGGYGPADICFVAAFDIDRRKVGRRLAEAIFAKPNCVRFGDSGLYTGASAVEVVLGPVLDGCPGHMADWPSERAFRPVKGEFAIDAVRWLQESRAEVLVNYMPVGAEDAARYYAHCAIEAGCGFINAMPSFIASDYEWAARFERAGLPIIGDDVKSQFGATYVHRALVAALAARGCTLRRTYQLNTGGNTDFLNMLDRTRLASKKRSKTVAVTSQIGHELPPEDVHIGPSDYVPWQNDNKVAFIRLEADGCAGAPIELELRLSVQDSPNSAGVVIDAIRFAGLARRAAIGGVLTGPSAWLMKHPPRQLADNVAKLLCDEAARGNLDALLLPD